jgi:hypothetical protein
MAISEIERHHLHTRLEQVLGQEDAAVLMSHLPPSGWSDVVRVTDLDARVALVDARFDTMEARLDAKLAEQANRTVGRLAAIGGLLLLVDQLVSRL